MRVPVTLLAVLLAFGCAGPKASEPTDVQSGPADDPNGEASIPFEDPQLVGLCEDMQADFAEGEPSPSASEEEAAAQFVKEHSILEGLDVGDGKIVYRGQQVGSYRIVERPGGTFAVESAGWCYPTE